MAKPKRETLKAAKEARQKKIAVVGGVVLLAVLAIQVPRTMDLLDSGAGESAPVTAAPAPGTSPDSGAPGPEAAPAAGGPAAVLVDSDPLPSRSTQHVVTFERFASKDPFVQQVSPEAPPAPAPVAAVAAPAPQPSALTPQPQASTPAPAPAPAAEPSRAPSGAVVVEVNGKRETVALAGTFPQADPTFRLVSLAGKTAMIGLAGGTYANGVQTVALQLGKTLTLANTADGVRYELRLVAVG